MTQIYQKIHVDYSRKMRISMKIQTLIPNLTKITIYCIKKDLDEP